MTYLSFHPATEETPGALRDVALERVAPARVVAAKEAASERALERLREILRQPGSTS